MTSSRVFPRAESTALSAIAICMAVLLVTSLAFAIDDRLLRGVNIWSKPVKFAAAFGLHLATLLVFVRLLTDPVRRERLGAMALVGASVATLIEVLYVALQSARGRESHFNTDTALESFMYYQVMGGAALVLVGATVLVGVLVLRDGRAGIGPGLRLGAGWGAILSAIATLAVAGILASGTLSGPDPWIGEPRVAGAGMPIVGWSREVGDLRVPHFIATHLIQAMALAGWLVDSLAAPRQAFWDVRAIVGGVACAGLGLIAATFALAARGIPLIQ